TFNIKFDNASPLNKSTAYSILVIANVIDPNDADKTIWGTTVADWLSSFTSFTEEEVIRNSSETRSSGVASGYGTSPFTQNNLLMSARVTKEVGQPNVRVALNRLVSRFDVELHGHDYEIQSVSIWNAYPETSIWERKDFEYSDMRLRRFYGVYTDIRSSYGGLYAFENYVTNPVVNDNETTCLIIGLMDVDDDVTYYYRQNINAYETPQQLKRNNVYSVSIQRVNAHGAASEEEAYKSEEVLLETIINTWNMGQNGEMLYNGESVLILPTSLVSFTPLAETREYKVHTQGLGTLSISGSTLPTGITATLDGDVLTITAGNGTSELRSGYVELAFGSLRGIINVNQEAAVTTYIELSVTSIPVFPGNAASTSEVIRVNSSGPWTAELYNVSYAFASGRPVFAFGATTSTTITTAGNSGGSFTISATGKNEYQVGSVATEVVSFLLVQLDSDPTVRKVLMLTQKPTGGFAMGSQQKQLQFDALGAPLPGASNLDHFTVTTSESTEEWSVTISGDDASAFEIRDQAGTGTFTSPHTGNGTFTIKAADNAQDKELSAVATIELGPQTFEIRLTQAKHVMSITPHSVTPLLVAGGTTRDITVHSSATGKTWKATLVNSTTEHLASLSSTEPAITSITGQALDGTFAVTFPKLELPFIVPQATVTVQMEDYPWLTATLVVSQQSYQPRAITLQTAHSTYGRADVTGSAYNYFSAVSNGLREKTYFGPSGTVRTASGSLISWPQNATVSNNSSILLINSGLNSSQRNSAIAWRKVHQGNMLIFLLDLGSGDNQNLLRTIYSSTNFRLYDPGISSSDWGARVSRTPSGGNGSSKEKLLKYLVGGDGPFGAVNFDNVDLTPRYDMVDGAIDNTVANYPSSLVALLAVGRASGSWHIQLAIDPVQNLIFIGNMDMFSGVDNRFPAGSDNWKFLHNLLAYIVNAAQYGDVFLKDFR
ncbi:MAG: hypothetical protein LBF09_02615, partial [Odoribacteraceae bacterium]|nr:hypothetical protein [Odoribacteraceae bacterium]